MAIDKLKEFYNDKAMQDAWAEFIVDVLDTEALKRVYLQEDTTALKETRDIITRSFAKLNELYKPKEDRKVDDITS